MKYGRELHRGCPRILCKTSATEAARVEAGKEIRPEISARQPRLRQIYERRKEPEIQGKNWLDQ